MIKLGKNILNANVNVLSTMGGALQIIWYKIIV